MLKPEGGVEVQGEADQIDAWAESHKWQKVSAAESNKQQKKRANICDQMT